MKQHLAQYDRQLKKFNVSKALDAALEVHISLFMGLELSLITGDVLLQFRLQTSISLFLFFVFFFRNGQDINNQKSQLL